MRAAATKTLHHILPDLVVPMDRRWTGAFYMWSPVHPQIGQYQTFWLTYQHMVTVAREVQPSQYVKDGRRTSLAKIIDSAVVRYRHYLLLGIYVENLLLILDFFDIEQISTLDLIHTSSFRRSQVLRRPCVRWRQCHCKAAVTRLGA